MSVLLGFILHVTVHQHLIQRREQESVLMKVASIMSECATPFCWLNEKNEFVYANNSFINLLGYDSLKDIQEQPDGLRRTLRGMMDLPDQHAYDSLRERSAKGLPTDRYSCGLRTKQGTWLRIDAHGERMPFGGRWRNEGPHRFGVILSSREQSRGVDEQVIASTVGGPTNEGEPGGEAKLLIEPLDKS
jgi:hypothetical protein